MSQKEKQALKILKQNSNITIKSSDKGGNIVVMDNTFYIDMCEKILSNKDWYQKINMSKIAIFNQQFYQMIDQAYTQNILEKPDWDFIRTTFPKIPTFYSLPKLHKSMDNPSGKPIVSGNGCLTENLSTFIDAHLRPFVTQIPSYIRDTTSVTNCGWSLHLTPINFGSH